MGDSRGAYGRSFHTSKMFIGLSVWGWEERNLNGMPGLLVRELTGP